MGLHRAAALRPLKRRGGDAREQACRIALKIRHARRTVVEHPGAAGTARHAQLLEHRQAGVRAGKDVHLRPLEPTPNQGQVLWVAQVFLGKAPAGQGLGVAVHQPHTHIAHLRHAPHGQTGQLGALFGRGGRAQLVQDAVGARDHVLAHPVGVGAAAASLGVGVVFGQLGLDVAAQGHMRQDRRLHPREDGRVDVKPVKVAVEHQALTAGFLFKQAQHLVQRQLVAIQAAHHVQRVQISQ